MIAVTYLAKNLEQVKKVLEQIDYVPNIIAKSLRSQRTYTIGLLIPDPNTDQYWQKAYRGVDKFIKEYGGFGMSVSTYFFSSTEVRSFIAQSESCLASQPDGILIAPMYLQESISFLKECDRSQVSYVIVNSEIDQVEPLSYIGQDLLQSGRTAAHLIHTCRPTAKSILILHLDENPANAPHMNQKELGFRSYFNDLKFETEIISQYVPPEEIPNIDRYLSAQEHIPNTIGGIFISISKAYLVIEKIGILYKDAIVVGYDLLKKNVDCLNNGTIDFLINQNPEQHIYLGLSCFGDHFTFDKPVNPKTHSSLDIVSKENVGSYK